MSFLNMNQAIETSVLSSRWRFVWTSMPHLNFSSKGFSTLPKFSKFIKHVMSRLKPSNNLTDVYSVKLSLCGQAGQSLIKKILDHVLSHNIKQLDVVCVLHNDIEFPLSFFSSQSLKHLSVKMKCITRSGYSRGKAHLTSSLDLPGLTRLDLHSVTLCDDSADTCIGVFSKCVNLENLTLNEFDINGSNSFSISHPRLSNLTLENICYDVEVVNVAAPQLKNLTIRDCAAKLVISACNLTSLLYKGSFPCQLSTESFSSLEKANLCFQCLRDEYAHGIVCLLQQLRNVKFLTLNLEIVEDFSISELTELKHLSTSTIYMEEQANKKVAMSAELKSYLLDSSPGCIFTMVSREEALAQKLMADLQVLLVKERGNSKQIMKSHKSKMKLKHKNGGNIVQIESLGVQIEQQKEKAFRIISKFKDIETSLKKLPASHWGKIQPRFSSLCAEADIDISKITERMKIQCDEYQSRSSVLFHELATTLVEPSS